MLAQIRLQFAIMSIRIKRWVFFFYFFFFIIDVKLLINNIHLCFTHVLNFLIKYLFVLIQVYFSAIGYKLCHKISGSAVYRQGRTIFNYNSYQQLFCPVNILFFFRFVCIPFHSVIFIIFKLYIGNNLWKLNL